MDGSKHTAKFLETFDKFRDFNFGLDNYNETI